MVNERIEEIMTEYNDDLTKGREPITECKYHKTNGTITIFFVTFAYHIFIYKDTYVLSWFRKDIDRESFWIHDGTEYCPDVATICRSLGNRIFGGFSPRRGKLWYQHDKPKKPRKRKFIWNKDNTPA